MKRLNFTQRRYGATKDRETDQSQTGRPPKAGSNGWSQYLKKSKKSRSVVTALRETIVFKVHQTPNGMLS